MKKYLLTGASGFLGSIIVSHLSDQAMVTTLGRKEKDTIQVDITNDILQLPTCDVVVHTAGLAHMIPKTDIEKQEFHNVNYKGTVNLCKALINANGTPKTRLLVFISSVSVYGLEKGIKITEEADLLGNSPYAKSKIDAEIYLREWAEKHKVNLVILRLPLIVGANPVGNLAKIIEAQKSGKYLNIAGGKARKSMVLAQDIAELIGKLKTENGTYNLTDMYDPSFKEITSLVSKKLGLPKPLNLPLLFAKPLGFIGDIFRFFPINSILISKMTNDLTFDSSKAVKMLGWQPKKVLSNFDAVFQNF